MPVGHIRGIWRRVRREWRRRLWSWRRLPQQTFREIALYQVVLEEIVKRLSRPPRIFEWGAGSSTVYYSKWLRNKGIVFEWHAIDNSPLWYSHVQKNVRLAGVASSVRLHLAEFNPFWEDPGWDGTVPTWVGAPLCTPAIREYIACPLILGGRFDVILVDGRFRKRCLLVAREALQPEGAILLHDASRRHYLPGISSFPHGRYISGGNEFWDENEYVTWLGVINNLGLLGRIEVMFGTSDLLNRSHESPGG